MDRPLSGADVTRQALIDSAIKLFGDRSYDAVSTRDIADMAAANIGSIAYHFGGKAGLRRACAEHVIRNVLELLGPAFTRPLPPLSPDEALNRIEQFLTLFCHFWLLNPDSRAFVRFIVREQLEGGEVADIFYGQWMKPMHSRFCALFSTATGRDPDDDDVKIAVFAFVGQVFHFRVGAPIIMRRLNWDEMDKPRAEKVIAGLLRNTRAITLAHRVLA